MLHRHRWLTPYLLLAPGLAFLALFFLVPLGFLGHQSLETQNPIDFTHSFNWAWHNYSDALTTYHTQLVRSFEYAAIATAIALLLSYPLAYWIAFRGGRWKNLFLLMIIAPFFVTYLIRTLAWETILADQGPVVHFLRYVHLINVIGTTTGCSRRRPRSSPASPTTSCRSWRSRSMLRWSRSTRG